MFLLEKSRRPAGIFTLMRNYHTGLFTGAGKNTRIRKGIKPYQGQTFFFHAGWFTAEIASYLNGIGRHTAYGKPFTTALVHGLRREHSIVRCVKEVHKWCLKV